MHQSALDEEDERQPSPLGAAPSANQRAAPRHTLLIRSAKLVVRGCEYLCVLRDASATGVSLRLFHDLALAPAMTLELQNEERHAVELVWQNGERLGLRFSEPVDVHRLIEMPAPFDRRPIRVRLNTPAIVGAGEVTAMCTILDLSQQGAKLSCSRPFAIDQRVRLVTAGMPNIPAKIRWRSQNELGLAFETTFQLPEFAEIVARLHNGAAAQPAIQGTGTA